MLKSFQKTKGVSNFPKNKKNPQNEIKKRNLSIDYFNSASWM